jgi:hypothetical protein
MRNADIVNSGTRGNKTGLLCSLSAFPSFIKPGTGQTGLTGRFQKSFYMNSWHLLRKSEKLQRKRERKKILGLMTDGKRKCIFWQRVLRKCAGVERQRKRRLKRLFQKFGCQLLLSKEIILGHPCVPRVRVTRLAIRTEA